MTTPLFDVESMMKSVMGDRDRATVDELAVVPSHIALFAAFLEQNPTRPMVAACQAEQMYWSANAAGFFGEHIVAVHEGHMRVASSLLGRAERVADAGLERLGYFADVLAMKKGKP